MTGFAGAFAAGVLTLLSPCSVMLLPAFFSYAFAENRLLLARTGLFYLGLCATLVPIGVLAATLGAFVSQHRAALVTGAAVVVIALGVAQLLGIPLPGLSRTAGEDTTSGSAVFLLGGVYGLTGSCAGPLVGSVLATAALGADPLYGGLVLFVFAAGMTVPLLLLALLWSRFTRVQDWLRPREVRIGRWRNTWVAVVSGLFCVGVGVFFLVTGGDFASGLLGVDEQYEVEAWALRGLGSVPDLLVAGAAAAALVVFALIRRKATRKREAARAEGQ